MTLHIAAQDDRRARSATWRALDLTYGPGPEQLAATEVLLERVGRGDSRPVLRFYSWSEPVVILGVGQSSGDLDLDECRARGYRVLRRISGGTAVYHDADEVSVEVVVPADSHFAPSDVIEAYRRFAAVLQTALERLGIAARAVDVDEARGRARDPLLAPACFGDLAPFELTVDGRKLVGLSQIRRRGASVLQAALYQRFRVEPLAAALRLSVADRDRLATRLEARVIDLTTAAGRPTTAIDVVHAVSEALREAIGAPLQPAVLSEAEQAAVATLVESKYANPNWTFRR